MSLILGLPRTKSSKLVSVISFPGSHVSTLYGPEPIGRAHQVESDSTCARLTIAAGTAASRVRNVALGAVREIERPLSDFTSIPPSVLAWPFMTSANPAISERNVGPASKDALPSTVAGFTARDREKATSSAVIGLPSWNVAPSLTTKLYVRPSAETSYD